MFQFRLWQLLGSMLVVGLSLAYWRFAHTAAFEIVNQSGGHIEIELVNCTNHTTKKHNSIWIADGKKQNLTIVVNVYDYTSVRVRDRQGKYIRWGREYKTLPYGKAASYTVFRNSLRDVDESIGYVVIDTREE